MKRLDGNAYLQQKGLAFFREASTFGALSDQAVSLIFQKGELLQFDVGESLFQVGDESDCFFIILSGRIALIKRGRRMHGHGFGEEMGVSSMFALQKRAGVALVEEPAVVVRVSTDLFYQLHEQLPADFGILMINLSREIARKLRGVTDAISRGEI